MTASRLAEIDPALESELAVSVVPDTNPWRFSFLSAVGILVGLGMEKRLNGEGGAVILWRFVPRRWFVRR